MTRVRSLVAILAVAACFSSCSKTTAPETEVSFSVVPSTAVGSPGSAVDLSGRAINTGTESVWYTEGCGVAAGVRLHFYDPTGNEIYLRDPRAVPACADQLVMLAPGREVRNDAAFTGTIFMLTQGGVEQAAAPFGEYTVRAEFAFSRDHSTPHMTTTCSTTFRWEPAPGGS